MIRRVAVLGSAASGKSTLSVQLSDILNIEVFHLDALYWKPGWTRPDRSEFDALVREIVARDEWIIDGDDWRTIESRLERADLVVFLDFHPLRCLVRATKRRVQYAGVARPDLTPGCEEKLDLDLIRSIWNYPKRDRTKLLPHLAAHETHTDIYYLHSPFEVRNFLQEMRHRYQAFPTHPGTVR